MPVCDFHVHVGARSHWNTWVMDFFAEMNQEYTRDFADEIDPQSMQRYLEGEAVDRAVMLAEYAPQTTGIVTNEYVRAFCDEADRLIPFGALCLYEGPEPVVQAERCIRELGCKGLKFLPTYAHFFPDDPRLMPVYELARDLEIPVMFHTGTSIFKGARIKYGNPLLLDDVADEFPDLVIVMSHGGRPFWYAEAQWMLRRHKKVHVDISGIPPKHLPTAFPHLEKFQDRFVFGSDWPGIPSISRQVRMVQDLPYSAQVIEAILWDNAARLLRLDKTASCGNAPGEEAFY